LWAVSSSLLGRVEAGIPGDGFFSQDYSVARRDPSLVSTLRDYNLSATFTRPHFTLGLVARRLEMADTSSRPGDVFVGSSESMPQLNFTLFPRTLFLKEGPKLDMTAQADRTFTRANGYIVNRVTGEIGLSQSVVVGAAQSFFFRTSLQEAYQDRPDLGLDNGGETTSLGLNSTWLARWTWFLSTTFTHTFSRKLNGLRPTDPIDGLRIHQATAALEATFGSELRLRTGLSYDLALKVPTDSQRFSYLRQEVHWNPSAYFNGSVFADYSIKADALKNLNAVMSLRGPNEAWRARVWGNFVDPDVGSAGVTLSGTPLTFHLGGEVAFALFDRFRISLLQTYNVERDRLETRSVSLYRDLHDWEAEVNYAEDLTLGKRVFFKLNLKVFPGRPLSVSEDDLRRLNGLRDQGLTGAAGQFN
jgi:hypothetical protein